MNRHAPSFVHDRAERGRRGFALLITITLLAFLVLLLVSLASLTRVETQVAGNNQQLAQARQNALMALNIALGQLQKYTGPDQRVTASADIASAADGGRLDAGLSARNASSVNGTSNGLAPGGAASVQPGTRYWTGVWGRAGASYANPAASIYDETPSPVLLNWLVSGNEDRAFEVDADGWVRSSEADGRAAGSTAEFTPGSPIDWSSAGLDPTAPETWSSGNYASLQINTAGQRAVLLVGPKTAGTESDAAGDEAVHRYVVAPVKDIAVASSTVPGAGASGTTTVGRYAWWIGDEGVKASYNLVDPHAGANSPGGANAAAGEARVRLMSASRSGVELLDGFDNYPAADAATAGDLEKLVQWQQASLLDPTLTDETRRARFHDLTPMSSGVLSNTLAGGLRQDLTYHFELSPADWASSPLAGQGIIPAPWSPRWTGLGDAPKWDWLYSFYNTNPDVASGELALRAETPTRVGVTPIITQFRLIVFTDRSRLGPLGTVQNIPPGNYALPIRCNVAFVLANPYNVRLTAPAHRYEFVIKNSWTGAAPTTFPLQPNGLVLTAHDSTNRAGPMHGHFVLIGERGYTAPSMIDTVRFRLPSIDIPAGGTCVLSVQGNTQRAGSSPSRPIDGSEEIVDLEVNDAANPIAGRNSYFEANSTFSFVAPPPRVYAWTYMHDVVPITLTLREAGSGDVLQQLVDGSLSKGGGVLLGSVYNEVFLSAHIHYLPPARRTMDSTGAENLHDALYTYARPYQDLNLRAKTLDRNALDMANRVINPISYSGGFSREGVGSQSVSGDFTADLTPAPWAENFGSQTRSPVASRGVFFDFPRRTAQHPPVLSIAQLQHASLSADDWHPGTSIHYQPAYAVGNSYSNPFVTRGRSVDTRAKNYYKAPVSATRHFDLAYLLNTSLWDGYFFSGVPQSGGSFAPLNPRYTLHDADDASDVRTSNAAAHLVTKGAFNINSTSQAAWAALLGGLNTLRVRDDATANGVPFPRTLWQPVENSLEGTSYKPSGTGDDTYAGYRRLTRAEIHALAAEIVKRVRARGPFVSLSHFVNRSLVAASGAFNASINDSNTAGDLAAAPVPMGRGLSGPLQAAIDSSAAGINTFQPVGGDVVTAEGREAYGDRMLFAGEMLSTSSQRPAVVGEPGYNTGPVYFADKLVDLPHLDPVYGNAAPPGPQGRTSTGTPGWLMQGDVLQAIAPALSARSDTFVIRAYGEVVNPVDSSRTEARAWCEAVVQRVPGYVQPAADNPEIAPAALTSPENRRFGRAYKVISFRWLAPSDI